MTESKFVRASNGKRSVLDNAVENSRIAGTVRKSTGWCSNVVQNSALFRWLTAEPDPDVIVIDLRETKTVGPFIALIDRLVPRGERLWNGSRSRHALEQVTTTFRNAPVQSTSALVLGLLVVQFVLSWGSIGGVSLALGLVVAGLALLGLRVNWTWDELVDSKVGQWTQAILMPPEPPEGESR